MLKKSTANSCLVPHLQPRVETKLNLRQNNNNFGTMNHLKSRAVRQAAKRYA